jgi:hypothetical protein
MQATDVLYCIFQNYIVGPLVISRVQWLILAEGKSRKATGIIVPTKVCILYFYIHVPIEVIG